MVQNKDIEEKPLVNGEIKKEENGISENGKTNGNGDLSDYEESDDDDYLDHLLMLPPLDNDPSNRNRSLVSKTLLDFCSAIESRKEYAKIKQELLMNCVPMECKQEDEKVVLDNEPIVNGVEEPPTPPQIEVSKEIEVKPELDDASVPDIRRQSIRLKKAQFGELKELNNENNFYKYLLF
jgi:hypothetical protein